MLRPLGSSHNPEGHDTSGREEGFDLLSQGSSFSFAEGEDITPLIEGYQTQPTSSGPAIANTSFDPVPSTQSTTESGHDTENSSAVLTTSKSVTLGKRKQHEDPFDGASSPARAFKHSRSEPTLPLKRPKEPSTKSKTLSPVSALKLYTDDYDLNKPVDLTWLSVAHASYNKLPYAAQWEITRAVFGTGSADLDNDACVKFIHIEPADFRKLQDLGTNVAGAPGARKLIASKRKREPQPDNLAPEAVTTLYAKERAANCPWAELDREEEALKSGNPLANLGFAEDGTPLGTYGGKVEFRGSLTHTSTGFQIRIEQAVLGPSHQLARRFGSKNFFRLRLTKNTLGLPPGNKDGRQTDPLMDYLKRPLFLCGGVFRAFYAKETNVFYVKTNESPYTHGLTPDPKVTSDLLSFLDFIAFHNCLVTNSNQKMAKWSSRFALGLSNSAPGWLLKPHQIKQQPDIEHPETHSVMTDGAGSLSRHITSNMYRYFGWNERPTAIQVRVFGGKGLLVDDLQTLEKEPVIYLTPSQTKIKYDAELCDPAHRVIDVLRSSCTKTPCRLSIETIINMGENGVPAAAFANLLRMNIEEALSPLLEWEQPKAGPKLWYQMQKNGGVIAARRSRENSSTARVMGFSEYALDENEPDDEDGFTQRDILDEKSVPWWADPQSGCPSSLEETVMLLLDSNFKPRSSPFLHFKMEKAIKKKVKSMITKYRTEVPMSCSAWITPDRLGVLEEGEFFFRSSHRNLLLPNGTENDQLEGIEVLVTRNPCKLPTDVQKWRAVYRPELRDQRDVVVLSTKGKRRAADWLGGGDYDGDKVSLIWDPTLVKDFVNAPPHFGDPPSDKFTEDNFTTDNISAEDFQKKIKDMSDNDRAQNYQDHLLRAIQDSSLVGTYSSLHDNATYRLGYRHPETIRLAHMFCMTLDGTKTGLKVKREVLEDDNKKYSHRPPLWKESTVDEEAKERAQTTNLPHLKRRSRLGPFIMDELHKTAQEEKDSALKKVEDFFKAHPASAQPDPALTSPYLDILKRSETEPGYEQDLKEIRETVHAVYIDYKCLVKGGVKDTSATPSRTGASPKKTGSPRKQHSSFLELPIGTRQDILRGLSRAFAVNPSQTHMPTWLYNTVKASYAYYYDSRPQENGRYQPTSFPFDVAFRELGHLKASEGGQYKTVHEDFYALFMMKHPHD